MSTNIELEVLCRNIRNLRKHYKLSQKAMAKQLHIGVKTLNRLEQGEIPPMLGVDILFYIRKSFGFTPSQTLSVDALQYLSGSLEKSL